MKKVLFSLIFIFSFFNVISQVKSKPQSVGLTKEFSGKIEEVNQFEGDYYIVLKTDKQEKFDLYFMAGSCGFQDKYEIEYNVPDELMDKIQDLITTDNKVLNIKATAKSTYGMFCTGKGNKKMIIWRIAKASELN